MSRRGSVWQSSVAVVVHREPNHLTRSPTGQRASQLHIAVNASAEMPLTRPVHAFNMEQVTVGGGQGGMASLMPKQPIILHG
jgi:hypothetical protein